MIVPVSLRPVDDLVTEHFTYTRNVARTYCRQRGLAEMWHDDVNSWAMKGLLGAARTWNGTGTFRAYLHRAIHNTIKDGWRTMLGRHGQKVNVPLDDDETPVVDRNFEEVEQVDLLRSIEERLSPREYDFVVTAEFAPTKEAVASRWAVTPGRVSQVRTSERVRDMLAPLFGKEAA